jgi:hypothetical protein
MLTREARKRIAEKAHEMFETSKVMSKELDKRKEAGTITTEEKDRVLDKIFEMMAESQRLGNEAKMKFNGYRYDDLITGLSNMG